MTANDWLTDCVCVKSSQLRGEKKKKKKKKKQKRIYWQDDEFDRVLPFSPFQFLFLQFQFSRLFSRLLLFYFYFETLSFFLSLSTCVLKKKGNWKKI